MDYQQLYNKYYSRMSKEGILKSFVFALLIGFGITAVIALTTWIVGFDAGVWIALGGLVVATAAATPIFYYCVFRPTEKSVAKRLDSLGMEERIITMQELQGDTSVMANLQRADAVNKVATTEAKSGKAGGKFISFKVSLTPIIITACVGCLAVAAMIIAGLSSLGIIRYGRIVFAEAFTNPTEYSVQYGIYGVEQNNAALGNPDDIEQKDRIAVLTGFDKQKVKAGGSTGEVLYTADNYYYFLKWLDGFDNEYTYQDGYTPSRHEDNVNDDLDFKAQFDKLEAAKDDLDLTRRLPSGGGSGSSGGGTGGGGGGNANISLNENDFIINNKIKYTDDYDTYYGDAMIYLANADNLSAEERAMMETYFEILK